MKVLILASQHGDEYSGEKLYDHIKAQRPELLGYVSYMVGNPRARRQRRRYSESDMNRSYTGRHDTYEERRAAKVLGEIDAGDYDLVLDMHTTTVKQPPCLIMAAVGPETERFIRASHIGNIVVMRTPLVTTSVNGARKHAVSVEVHEDMPLELLERLCDDISRYLGGETATERKYVYEVTDVIDKSELSLVEVRKLRNFELSPHGYYPVLAGENSYGKFTSFRGFKAYKRYEFKV